MKHTPGLAGKAAGLTWNWSRALWLGVGLCLWIAFFQPSSDSDRRISDNILVGAQLPADPDYVIIEVTRQDLQEYGRPILSRENMTRLLETIRASDPERLLMDLHAGDTIADDAQLRRAEVLESFDKGQLGIVTALGPRDLPHPRYAAAATMLEGRLTADVDGWHRKVGRSNQLRGNNPAIWLASGHQDTGVAPIDLRIAQEGFLKVSAGDVLEGRVDLSGRKIVLSANPQVAPTRAYLPHAAEASRAEVLAAAALSVERGYPEVRERGELANLAIVAFAALIGLVSALYVSSGRRLLLIGSAAVVAIVASHVSLAKYLGVPVTPTASITCFIIMANATLVQRFRIIPLLQNFLRGDLSPEEAWSWRAQEESSQPAILLGADGRIKRCNAAGDAICDLFGNRIALECSPRSGARAEEIRLTDSNSGETIYELSWPYAHVPIVLLRDVTELRHQHETLIGQLYQDELTGCANRRGFDRALAAASGCGEGYQLFFIDLNGFKEINDRYGHDAGDELLVACAQRLQHMTREEDVVARLGGDEFAVLMHGTHAAYDPARDIRRFANKITQPIRLTSTDGVVTVGAAIGHASPRDEREDVSLVLRRADQAMYRNKEAAKRAERAEAA